VIRVYVDASATRLDREGPGPSLAPGAADALLILLDSDHEVILVTGPGADAPPKLATVATQVLTSVPAQPSGQAWYLTSDVERCQGSSARLRTVLIGPAPPSGSIHRCDAVARDLRTAVLEILASEAAPGT
jgi:hypothetical protein